MGEPALSCQGSLATTTSGGDALTPFRIGHVASGVDPGSAGFGAASLGGQVTVAINLQLASHQAGVGGVANGVEEALHRQLLASAAAGIPEGDCFEPVATAGICHLAVPMHGDGGVGEHPIGHGATGPQLVAAHDQVHLAAVFGQINSLLTGGIAPTHHGQFGLTELGRGAVTDRTGADPLAPEALLAWQA